MTTIIISALILCGIVILLTLLFMRPSEILVSDKAVDLSSVMPIQTITDNVIINGNDHRI